VGHAIFLIETHQLRPGVWKILGQKSGLGPERDGRIGNGQLDRLDTDFEDVARLGARD